MSPGDPSQLPTHLAPTGFAATILAVTCVLAGLSFITVSLRTVVRFSDKLFGLDDGLMLVGLILFLAECGVVSYGTFVGLGYKDESTDDHTKFEAVKYVILWQIFYVTSLCAIKCAICITLARIAEATVHRFTIYGITVLTCATSLIGFPGTAICTSNQVITYISYLVSISSIVTDFACAIVPIFILWSTQIRARAKFSVVVVLALGTFASVTTIARIPFLKAYREPEDNFLYKIGYVIILSLSECGIGLIAGSLPMVRRLVRKWRGQDDESNETSRLTPLSFMTFGGSGRSRRNTIASLGPRGRNGNPARGISQATVRAAQPSEEWEKLESGSGSARLPTPDKDKDKGESHSSILERRSVTIEYEIRSLPGLSETKSLPRFSRSSWANSLNRSRSSST
uniref:Rhodopsin domain-containing protein n=1 Tax=Bionectria ochroleuca TaxID=29856 RepID=A0A8H7NQH5_BIOOC